MEDFTIGGFEHTALYAKKERMEEVIDFYVNFMGFEKNLDQYYEQYDFRMVFVVKDGFLIELCSGDEKHDPGTIDHFCFRCTNIGAVANKLTEMGYDVEKRTDVFNEDGSMRASMQFFVGPVGERIELYEEY